MRLARFAFAFGTLALASGLSAETLATAPAVLALEPVIEVKVAADRAERTFKVDVTWPSGLRPRFPRDEDGIISARTIAKVGLDPTAPGLIAENPEWAGVCEHEGCRLTYRVDFGKGIASDKRGDWGFEERQRIVMAPLVRWLVRPEDRRARGRLRIDFDGGKGFELVSGVTDGRTNHIETDLMTMDGPHVVLGDFIHRTIELPGGRIDVAIGPGPHGVTEDDIVQWVREGALDVTSLLGRLPLQRLQIIVGRGGPYAIGSAVTMGMGGGSIFVVVGERTRKADLLRDWVMTHEMLHVALPNLGFRQRWMEEGLSTYLEPLLRARRGRYDTTQMWGEFVRAMPQGLPKDGDEGLDRTAAWGRTYWGGALFWFQVDLEIRRRTDGRRSLDDVLRAVMNDGGNVAVRWDLARLGSVAKSATGTTVLRDTYDEWSTRAVTPDLGAIWVSLGIKSDKAERITFDDTAPIARLRRDMTARASATRLPAS
ncbi:MAG: hypothetical protein ABI672_10455 [Vicinamibacteria bacterium]